VIDIALAIIFCPSVWHSGRLLYRNGTSA